MKSIDSFATAEAWRLAQAVADGEVSALELTDGAIRRIETRDESINAVVVRDFDRARDQAREIDTAVARGARLPLMGVPMTVKETFNVAGLPTTFGLEFSKNYRPTADAETVVRLKSAGAVILGKTNVSMGLSDYQSVNPIYGATRNPHNLASSSGGSSGGSSAALAAGMVPLELGSDMGGSIRVPSAFTGVFGLYSSFGAISLEGHGPPGGGPSGVRSWGAAGPMARSAADLDLALRVLAGPSGRDATGFQLVLPRPRHQRLGDYRILILTQHPETPVDDEIVAALESLAEKLERAGAKIVRESELLPGLSEVQALCRAFISVYTGRAPTDASQPATPKDYFDVVTQQETLRRKWDVFYESFDIVIAPIAPTVAFPLFDEPEAAKRKLLINGVEVPYDVAMAAWFPLAGVSRLPATAVPIGRTASGLPIGVQLIGPFLEDRTTIALSGLIASEFGPGFIAPPGFA